MWHTISYYSGAPYKLHQLHHVDQNFAFLSPFSQCSGTQIYIYRKKTPYTVFKLCIFIDIQHITKNIVPFKSYNCRPELCPLCAFVYFYKTLVHLCEK